MRAIASTTAALLIGASLAAAQEAPAPDELRIYFDTGSSVIGEGQVATLEQGARLYREGSPLVMVVSGGADTVGAAKANLDLSIRRAQAVAVALSQRGIPIERLQVLGRGNSELLVDTGAGVDNAENRSVSITWR